MLLILKNYSCNMFLDSKNDNDKTKKKQHITPCKNYRLVLAYSEIPKDFSLVRSILSKLIANTSNYPYTNTLCAIFLPEKPVEFLS